MPKNSEDACRFKPSKELNDTPLRFEVLYDNGKARRDVCNWSNFAGVVGVD